MLVKRTLLIAGGVALAFAWSGGSANAQGVFTITSPSFKDGERLATKNAGNNKQNPKYVGGKSLMGLPHYFGPCTPPGAPHHYTFTLFATDLEPNALQPGLTRDELIKALDGHAKGATGIIGTFSKP